MLTLVTHDGNNTDGRVVTVDQNTKMAVRIMCVGGVDVGLPRNRPTAR